MVDVSVVSVLTWAVQSHDLNGSHVPVQMLPALAVLSYDMIKCWRLVPESMIYDLRKCLENA